MVIHTSSALQHWNYFLALEDDLNRLSRFIEFSEGNFSVYSVELARLLFAASSEIDVVAQQLCQQINADSHAGSISAYQNEITNAYPLIGQTVVTIPKFGLTLKPWVRWARKEVPLWWTAYNKVKHHRHTHYYEGNLKHTLNAIAGLFSLLLFFYRIEAHEGRLLPNPSLFQITSPFEIDRLHWSHATTYRLPETTSLAVVREE